MSRIEEFEQSRSLLLSLACRILGSVSDAQDAVEETWLRYESAPAVPVSAQEYLSAEVIRVSADVLRSARLRRDSHPGPWPCEPLPGDLGQDPERPPDLAQSLSTAAVLLMERLSPLERAVFVLQEFFGCGPARIAAAVGCSVTACCQLVASVPVLSGGGGGGGTVLPWPGYVVGADHVARVLAAIVPALLRIGVTMRPQDVDGGPGAVFRDRDGTILGALAFGIFDGRVHTVRWVIDQREPGGEGEAA
ncbi:sigma factor-like helix-turn-helix DNA-binding protein [Streptomyces sp. DH24]|uniref:sigma factor-like helix-turn-helix DNA-binding protein n=1 Tax=Streptomyces sp. DH24 TaxID=3040123 RepID=UPI002442C21F|nr:sigma factor-like helix-turn-helix DNA-binding protein [Streptomyces sp. DH24]MDG9720194.1 RNA polymerase subunit sigma-24 [Streptomyces sp. DH24]